MVLDLSFNNKISDKENNCSTKEYDVFEVGEREQLKEKDNTNWKYVPTDKHV